MRIARQTPVFKRARMRRLLVDLFEHQALLIAGLAMNGDVQDKVIGDFVGILKASHQRAVRQLRKLQSQRQGCQKPPGGRMHPALAGFVRELRRGGATIDGEREK